MSDELVKYDLKEVEGRNELGVYCGQLKNDAIRERGSYETRWTRNQKFQFNDPDKRSTENLPFPGAADHHMPLVQAIGDSVNDAVIQPIFDANPWVHAHYVGPDAKRAEELESDMQFLLEIGGLENAAWEIAPLVWVCGLAHFWVDFDVLTDAYLAAQTGHADEMGANLSSVEDDIELDGKKYPIKMIRFAGPIIDTVHMGDTLVYPLRAKKIESLRLIARKVSMRLHDIHEGQLVDRYFKDYDTFSTAPVKTEPGRTDDDLDSPGLDSDPLDEMIDVYAGFLKVDVKGTGFEKWMRVVFTDQDDRLLSCQPLDIRTVPVADARYHIEHNAYIPQTSGAHNLQGNQIIYNDAFNKLIDMGDLQSGPPIAAKGFGAAEIQTYGPRTLLTGIDADLSTANIGGDPSVLLALVGKVEQTSYASSGSSVNEQAQVVKGNQTATEVNKTERASNNRTGGRIGRFGLAIVRVAEITFEYYRQNYELLHAVYGDMLKCKDQKMVMRPVRFSLGASRLKGSPAQQMEMVMAIMELVTKASELDPTVAMRVNLSGLIETVITLSGLPNADKAVREGSEVAEHSALVKAQMIVQEALAQFEQGNIDILVPALMEIAQTIQGAYEQGTDGGLPPEQGMGAGLQMPLGPGAGSNPVNAGM